MIDEAPEGVASKFNRVSFVRILKLTSIGQWWQKPHTLWVCTVKPNCSRFQILSYSPLVSKPPRRRPPLYKDCLQWVPKLPLYHRIHTVATSLVPRPRIISHMHAAVHADKGKVSCYNYTLGEVLKLSPCYARADVVIPPPIWKSTLCSSLCLYACKLLALSYPVLYMILKWCDTYNNIIIFCSHPTMLSSHMRWGVRPV